MSLEAIIFANGKLDILDQLLLPGVTKYIAIKTKEDAFKAIKDMNVSVC
jgi:methylthioribose-1-phosphate isomerase